MDERFNLDQLLEETPSKDEHILTQEKIKVQEVDVPTIIQEEAKKKMETPKMASQISYNAQWQNYAPTCVSRVPVE